jgi:hypothetical protein
MVDLHGTKGYRVPAAPFYGFKQCFEVAFAKAAAASTFLWR